MGYVFLTALAIINPAYAAIGFQEVTAAAGVASQGHTFGSAWGDFNNDGWPDLWNNNHAAFPSLYINNRNGTFTNIARRLEFRSGRGLFNGDTHGPAWADYDNDGDQDLIELCGAVRGIGQDPNHLYRNDAGVFRRVGGALHVDYPLGRGRAPLWLDYNNDGLLDLFVANLDRPDRQAPSTLFQQTARGFIDVGASMGLAPTPTLDFNSIESAHLADLTGDGRLDLVLLNNWSPAKIYVFDMSSAPFSERSTQLGLSPTPVGIRAMALGDFDGNLRSDLFLATYRDKFIPTPDKLYLHNGTRLVDKTRNSGLRPRTTCRSVVSGDFDNDQDLDLYLVCRGNTRNLPNILYENRGHGTFREVALAGGAAGSTVGTRDEAAVADYNRDGFLDLFLTNGLDSAGPNQLFRNRGNANHWIELDLRGVRSNRDGIGARIFVTAGGVTQLREQAGGMTYHAQNDKRIHFGLGPNALISLMRIEWPSGTIQVLRNVPANRIMTVTEP